jgi:hypothetical protein
MGRQGSRQASTPRDDRRGSAPPAPDARDSLEDEIRLRAYYRYLEREGEPGNEIVDWLEAEADVLGRRAAGVDADENASRRRP